MTGGSHGVPASGAGAWIEEEAASMLRAFLGRRRALPREAAGASRDPMFRKSGSSFDLKSIRDYQSSDDPRRIDWRLAARSGRLCVKEYFEEEREGLVVLVDLSASVRVFGPGAGGDGASRTLDDGAARRAAATMAWLAGALGMPVSVQAFASRPLRRLERPRGGLSRAPIESFFDALRIEPVDASGTDIATAVGAARATSRHGRLLLVSDFLDPGFRPSASPFRRNAFVRLHRPIESLFHGALELDVLDPESGRRIRLPWDRGAEAAYRGRERALEAELGEAERRGAFCRTLRPGDDRGQLYWDFLEALHA